MCSSSPLLTCRESLALMILFEATGLVLIEWMVLRLWSALSIACNAVLLADHDVALVA